MLDFPNNPVQDEVFQNWRWDGSKWVGAGGGQGLPPNIDKVPIAFVIPGQPAALQRYYVPITIPLTIPALLAGAAAYAGTAASTNVVFIFYKGQTQIGTVMLGATGTVTLGGAGASFAAGDVLILQAPTTQNATLSDIGITILAERA